jgi:hypothetical protein
MIFFNRYGISFGIEDSNGNWRSEFDVCGSWAVSGSAGWGCCSAFDVSLHSHWSVYCDFNLHIASGIWVRTAFLARRQGGHGINGLA